MLIVLVNVPATALLNVTVKVVEPPAGIVVMAGWEITNSCGAETSVKVTGPLSTKSVVPWLWMVKVLMIGVPITVEPKDVPSAVEGVVSLSNMVILFPVILISGPEGGVAQKTLILSKYHGEVVEETFLNLM